MYSVKHFILALDGIRNLSGIRQFFRQCCFLAKNRHDNKQGQQKERKEEEEQKSPQQTKNMA
jgi:hypothetical protein